MPLCQKTYEIVPEIVFGQNWFRISLISQSVHLNLSLVNAIRKKFIHFQCRKELCFLLLPALLGCVGSLQLGVIGPMCNSSNQILFSYFFWSVLGWESQGNTASGSMTTVSAQIESISKIASKQKPLTVSGSLYISVYVHSCQLRFSSLMHGKSKVRIASQSLTQATQLNSISGCFGTIGSCLFLFQVGNGSLERRQDFKL